MTENTDPGRLVSIWRYPMKGFNGERLQQIDLEAGAGLPFDRRFAIVSGNRADVPAKGKQVHSRTFIQNTIYEKLPTFDCQFDDETMRLTLLSADGRQIAFRSGNDTELDAAGAEVAKWFPVGEYGAPRIFEQAPDKAIWDYPDTAFSIMNLNSLAALEAAHGETLDPARFRGNLHIDGLPAWSEFDWIGRTIKIGDAQFEIIRPIDRCAATSIDPATGERGKNVPGTLQQTFGHVYCGVYARLLKNSSIKTDDPISIADTASTLSDQPDNAPPLNQWPRTARIVRLNFDRGSEFGTLDLELKNVWLVVRGDFTGQKMRLHDVLGGDESASEKRWTSLPLADGEITNSKLSLLVDPKNTTLTRALQHKLKNNVPVLISGPLGGRA